MNQVLTNLNVQESVQCAVKIKHQFNNIVQQLVQVRKDAGFTQQFMAEWLEVDRRKIIALESGELFDLLLLAEYADKMSMEININLF